jgi:hypothetical protein
MLHLFTQFKADLTEPFSLVISFFCLIQLISFFGDNKAANQPANRWFLFLKHQICQTIRYFMLRSNHATVGNLSVKLDT